MRIKGGWFSIDRHLVLNPPPVFSGSKGLLNWSVFTYLVACAGIFDSEIAARGEALVSMRDMADFFDVPLRKVRASLEALSGDDLITFSSSRRGTVVAVKYFDTYSPKPVPTC